MDNIIDNWSKLKKITEETIKVPFSYMVFTFLNILIYSGKGQKFSDIIISNQSIKKLLILLSELLSIIYNNYVSIFLTITLTALLILGLFEKTNIFSRLPDDVEFTDGTVISWNPVSAVKNLFSLMFSLSTDYFIFYCLLLFVVAPKKYIVDNYLIFYENLDYSNLLNILLRFNGLILFYFILRALFVIKYREEKRYLKYSSRYNTISSFSVSSDRDTIKYIIVRDGYYFSDYYLLRVETHKSKFKKRIGGPSRYGEIIHKEWIKEEISEPKRIYQILDKGENLSDIVYYYDELKKRFSND